MKTKIIVAVLLIVTAATGWYLYNRTEPVKISTSITGKWQLDSIDLSKVKDSSKQTLALFLISLDPSTKRSSIEFSDSGQVITYVNDSIDTKESYNISTDSTSITVGKDSTKESFAITRPAENKLQLRLEGKDSISYFLTKTR